MYHTRDILEENGVKYNKVDFHVGFTYWALNDKKSW